jgi:hypothetical protein
VALVIDGSTQHAPGTCRYREQVAGGASAAAHGDFAQHQANRSLSAGPSRFFSSSQNAQTDHAQPDPIDRYRRELPAYIRACEGNPDPLKPVFWCYTWKPEHPEVVKRAPYSCRSWRCPWSCADHEAHVLFTRMSEAFEDAPHSDLVMLVLTLDGPLHDLREHDLPTLYRTLGSRTEKFRKRLRRLLTREGIGSFGKDWCSVIEQHKSGVPHVNVLIRAPGWARVLQRRYTQRRCRGQSSKTAKLLGGSDRDRDELDDRFSDALEACGFGWRSSAEVARSRDAVIGYIGKVAGRADATASKIATRLHGRSVGELSKQSQLPVRAPKGFRRLRSGVHFLPRRRKGDSTGTIVRRIRTREGDESVRPIAATKKPELQAMQIAVCDLEQRLAWSDEDLRARERARSQKDSPRKARRAESISVHRIELPPELVRRPPPMCASRDGPEPTEFISVGE